MFTWCMDFMGCTSDVMSSEALCVGCFNAVGRGAGGLHGMGAKIGGRKCGGNEEMGRGKKGLKPATGKLGVVGHAHLRHAASNSKPKLA